MGIKDVANMLSRVPIFSGFSKRELEAVAREGKEVTHAEGSVIAEEGDQGLGFFLIVEGKATITLRGDPLKTLGPGEYFGEISLLTGGPRTASVTAATPIRLFGLTQWVFKRLIDEHPSMAHKMLKVIAGRLRESAEEGVG